MILDLRVWRSWVGLSQSELAALSGVTTMTVSELERGQAAPNASTIQRLAQAFGVPRTVLLHSTPEDEWARGWRPPEHDALLLERAIAGQGIVAASEHALRNPPVYDVQQPSRDEQETRV
jgi:transcriptional regulator with XRE-family HTH domain